MSAPPDWTSPSAPFMPYYVRDIAKQYTFAAALSASLSEEYVSKDALFAEIAAEQFAKTLSEERGEND